MQELRKHQKSYVQANTYMGVLFQVHNFFGKYSVKETFLEILKNRSEKLPFGISLDEYFWI